MWQCMTCFTLLSWWDLPGCTITWLGIGEKKPGSKEYVPVVNPGSASLSYVIMLTVYPNQLSNAKWSILLIVSVGWKRCWRMVWIVLVYITCLKLKLKKPQWLLMGRKCRTQDLENWYCHVRASVLSCEGVGTAKCNLLQQTRQVWQKC